MAAEGFGVGRRRGVGWGRGVGERVAVGLGLGVTLGVAVGVAVGVGDGVPQTSERKCSFSVWKPTPSTNVCPTAHTSQAVIAIVASSLPVTVGLGNTLQVLPSQ
jgi:hypothetical protein